jgi:hypothetical protein
MLGGGYGDLKTPTEPWFFSNPVWRARASQPERKEPKGRREGSRQSPARTGMSCRATSTRGEKRGLSRHPGVFLVTSLHEQREVTWSGAEHPRFKSRGRRPLDRNHCRGGAIRTLFSDRAWNARTNKKAAGAAFVKQKIEIRPISESAPDISAAIPLWTPDDSYRE